MQSRFKLLVLFLCLAMSNYSLAMKAQSTGIKDKFISISDIHFNPFFDCKPDESTCPLINKLQAADYKHWEGIFNQYSSGKTPNYRQNTNYQLLNSALVAVKQAQQKEHPKFILVLGDLLAHEVKASYIKYTGDVTLKSYEAFVEKYMQFLVYKIKKSLPDIDIYLVAGNNDSYTGDYGIVPNGKFFHDTATIWSSLIKNKNNQIAFHQGFSGSGYYSVLIPNTHDRIIALNTVLFSTNAASDTREAAQLELKWLDNQLKIAEQHHERVLLALHIPMGIDVYLTLNNPWKKIISFWQNDYVSSFMEILNKYPKVITQIHAGHIHKDDFQVLTLNHGAQILISYTPSISPIYRNNPSFKIFEYDNKKFDLSDYTTYYANLSDKKTKWVKEYNFDSIFQSSYIRGDLLAGINHLMASSSKLQTFYEKYYMIKVNLPVTAKDFNYYQCAASQFTYTNYRICLKEKMRYKFFFWG